MLMPVPPNTHQASQLRKTARWLPFIAWAFVLFCALYRPLPIYSGELGSDPDNYFRAAQVADFIERGNWFDTRQMRIEPPVGVDIYSRIVDVPLIAIAWPLTKIMGVHEAVRAAAFIVPLFILLPLAFFAAVWAYRPLLGVLSAAAPLVMICYVGFTNEFTPGRIDHHNWQIICTLFVIGGVLRLMLAETATRPTMLLRAGAIIAAAVATSFAVGMEAMPFLLVVLGALGLKLWQAPRLVARPLMLMGVLLPLFTFAFLALLRPVDQWPVEVLLHITLLHVKIAAAIGAIFVAGGAVALAVRNEWLRFWALGLVALAASAALIAANPELLQGVWLGYSPWLVDFTRRVVSEQQPMFNYAGMWPGIMLGVIAALTGYVLAWRKHVEQRPAVAMMAGAAALIALLTLVYAGRIDRFWWLFNVPGSLLLLRYGMAWMAQYPLTRSRMALEFMLILACGPLQGFAMMNVLTNARVGDIALFGVTGPGKKQCDLSTMSLFLDIAYKQPQTIFTADIIGPQLVFNTRHKVIGGGIYDYEKGLHDAQDYFGNTDKLKAAETLRGTNADLLLVCNLKNNVSNTEKKIYMSDPKTGKPADTLLRGMFKGEVPPYLKSVFVILDPYNGLFEIDRARLDQFITSGGK